MIEDEYKLLLAQTILGQMCHGLKVNFRIFDHSEEKMVELVGDVFSFDIYHGYIVGISSGGIDYQVDMMKVKPYLRPIESMTEEEKNVVNNLIYNKESIWTSPIPVWVINESDIEKYIDFCNSHHLDWRGLIERSLALEAPEGMYNIK